MGAIGILASNEIGGLAGREGAGMIAKKLGAGRQGQEVARNIGNGAGRAIGAALGAFSPFARGGQVPASKGMGYPALLHGQEYVLPYGIKPTKKQIQAVKKKGGRYHYKD